MKKIILTLVFILSIGSVGASALNIGDKVEIKIGDKIKIDFKLSKMSNGIYAGTSKSIKGKLLVVTVKQNKSNNYVVGINVHKSSNYEILNILKQTFIVKNGNSNIAFDNENNYIKFM